MLVEADDEHAVVWTKPDDLEVDLQKPTAGLAVRPPGGFLVAFADGSVHFLRKEIAADKLAALITRAGGEPVMIAPEDRLALRWTAERSQFFGLPEEVLRQLKLGQLLSKGIGNRIGLHVYDSEPVFDFSLPRFLGLSLGSFQGRGPFGNEVLTIGVLIAALNSPVYVSVPVQDAEIVDEFLLRLDEYLAGIARQGSVERIRANFRRPGLLPASSRQLLGTRLFVSLRANQMAVLLGQDRRRSVRGQPAVHPGGPGRDDSGDGEKPDETGQVTVHAMVRIRPQNWSRVLANYQLGWAENNREACLHNVGPMSSLARAFVQSTAGKSAEQVHAGLVTLGERFYDAHFFCPDGGQYQMAPDGKSVVCALHGSAYFPRQQATPAAESQLGRLLQDSADLTLTLTFLEDGLHAVATIDRR